MAHKLQVRVAAVLFTRLGVFYVPRFTVRYLHRYDVSFGLSQFFAALGLDYGHLVDPEIPEHEGQRQRLSDWVGLFLAAEEAVRGTQLDITPVETRVKFGYSEVDTLVDKLEGISRIWREVERLSTSWAVMASFRADALDFLQNWEGLQPDEVDDTRAAARHLVSWQVDFEHHMGRISRLLKEAARRVGQGQENLRLAVDGVAADYQELVVGLQRGPTDLDSAMQSIEQLAMQLEVLLETIEDGGAGEPQREVDLLLQFLGVLGLRLPTTSDEIKTRYRALARKTHPDVCPGDPSAKDRFTAIGEAYAWLIERCRIVGDPLIAAQESST